MDYPVFRPNSHTHTSYAPLISRSLIFGVSISIGPAPPTETVLTVSYKTSAAGWPPASKRVVGLLGFGSKCYYLVGGARRFLSAVCDWARRRVVPGHTLQNHLVRMSSPGGGGAEKMRIIQTILSAKSHYEVRCCHCPRLTDRNRCNRCNRPALSFTSSE